MGGVLKFCCEGMYLCICNDMCCVFMLNLNFFEKIFKIIENLVLKNYDIKFRLCVFYICRLVYLFFLFFW